MASLKFLKVKLALVPVRFVPGAVRGHSDLMFLAILLATFGTCIGNGDVMKMVDSGWIDKFVPRTYHKLKADNEKGISIQTSSVTVFLDPYQSDVSKDNNYGFSEQGMKDLDEVGGLVGGGDSDLLGILRPYYSMVEMSANGNKQGMGSYLHVLPDSEESDEPIYSVGGSLFGGIEPAGAKIGYMNRPFGR